ncbi:fructose-bisphosphate aldolase [Orussus abietinus]|uniref:fructose-bisphosphate aldolase n=1 Tax=Orussus abietinus TaxID=222816 RepID=UPI000625CAA6|nr:fructose-bisphosphate aldolase [Orussus abietinus]
MARLRGKCYCKEKLTSAITKYTELDPALRLELKKIVEALSAAGKGVLAADESVSTLEKKFHEINIENNEQTRRDYRQMLFSTEKLELARYISGVILNHETIHQMTSDGSEFSEFLRQRNIIPGVKVDKGLTYMFGTKDELTTQGLDDLQERCIQYKKDGCHFAKWKCVYHVNDRLPSQLALKANAHVLARYASICQSARLVPIVQSEILNTGDYDINRAGRVHEEMLSILFRSLMEYRVYLEGMILRPAMVMPGKDNPKYCLPKIIAEYTVKALQRTVPCAVPAIMFLGSAQSDKEVTLNLNAINTFEGRKPWVLSFCFGRPLRDAAFRAWSGNFENTKEAQLIFLKNAMEYSLASQGRLETNENENCIRSFGDSAG